MSPVDGNVTDGNICVEGQKLVRSWMGPYDACGNKADDILQTFTIRDQEGPKLPESLPALDLMCPSDLDSANLTLPKATDDCDENVTVTTSLSDLNACKR